MSAFEDMVDAQFEDPNLALDAIWRAGGTGDGLPVRVRRRSPEAIIASAGNQFDLDAMLIDVRLSEVPDPAEGDTVDLLDEDGTITETVSVIGMARIDSRRLVRTCEVAPVIIDESEGAGMASYDIKLRRGTNSPDIIWRLTDADGEPFQGQGSDFVLSIAVGGDVVLRKSTADAGSGLTYDVATGRLTWSRTLDESRLIPSAMRGRYEIERRIAGKQSFLLDGAVIPMGGLNDD